MDLTCEEIYKILYKNGSLHCVFNHTRWKLNNCDKFVSVKDKFAVNPVCNKPLITLESSKNIIYHEFTFLYYDEIYNINIGICDECGYYRG
jgi:hypothetical protein